MAKDIKDVVKAVYKPGHGPANKRGEDIARGIYKMSQFSKELEAKRKLKRNPKLD